jgi:hypothetical protein
MSSTRKAKDDSVYHQSRYASSAEFERGLLGNLVARRASMLDHREDRELIWAVHYLSHQDGGLELVARELVASYPQYVGTVEMLAIGKHGNQNHTSEELAKIAGEFPRYHGNQLLAAGGYDFESRGELRYKKRELQSFQDLVEMDEDRPETHKRIKELGFEIEEIEKKKAKVSNCDTPRSAGELHQLCTEAAKGVLNLPARDIYPLAEALSDLCLKPSRNLASVAPWYFSGMINALRAYVLKWTERQANFPQTSLGKIIAEEFDYTLHGRCLTLLSGEARRGKSFAAKNCCLKNIGRARFVEVPPGNDDTSFFRALARGLGLGNFLKYKAIDIRERVESVLLTGDLLLVLDEAQRLWPECWQRYARPARINWLMTIVNAKVPVLLISTPQFLTGQRVAERTGWNSAQLTGRISNHIVLPSKLSNADLMEICRFMLSEIGDEILNVLANYALISDRYLAAIESVAMRARHIAERNNRTKCNAKDVHRALKENIIPSDNLLNRELEKSRGELRSKLPRVEFTEENTVLDQLRSLPSRQDGKFDTDLIAPATNRAAQPMESHV